VISIQTRPNWSSELPRYRAAFADLEGERQALLKEQLLTVNTEVPAAVVLVQGRLDEIRALRPRIAAELPTFDLARFDKLETHLLALGHAHTKLHGCFGASRGAAGARRQVAEGIYDIGSSLHAEPVRREHPPANSAETSVDRLAAWYPTQSPVPLYHGQDEQPLLLHSIDHPALPDDHLADFRILDLWHHPA
jgi:hypothetical protein